MTKCWLRIMAVAAVGVLLNACSHIDADERLLYVEPAAVQRSVLVEEFSGQLCVNCPAGAEELERIQQEYGSDAVIVVTIHGGELALTGDDEVVGLRSEQGDQLYQQWGSPDQPSAALDRRSQPLLRDKWQGEVYKELQRASALTLAVETSYEADSRQLKLSVEAQTAEDVNGTLHVWLTEDGIVAPQMFPETIAMDYVHNHVFRMALGGISGTPVAVKWGRDNRFDYEVTLPADWNPTQLSAVAFIVGADGVEQVTRKKVIHS